MCDGMRPSGQRVRKGWAQARHLALTLTGACVRADAATAMCNNFWNRQGEDNERKNACRVKLSMEPVRTLRRKPHGSKGVGGATMHCRRSYNAFAF